ncbi:MAG: hypothetical protein ACR2RV_23320, partial [Verrucomicrobiales bacterium]
MDRTRRYLLGVVIGGVILFGLWYLFGRGGGQGAGPERGRPIVSGTERKQVGSAIPMIGDLGQGQAGDEQPPDQEGQAGAVPAGDEEELSEEERHMAIDREHMKRIHAGIFAYREKYGHYPEYLSQLVPEFVEADTIRSPKERTGIDEHTDPGLEKPYYGYEFSNLEFRDGRTFAEIKEIQRSEWGDVVPLLRAFGFSGGRVINMSYGGELYETRLNWEWDPATLDVVEKVGWGPGLDVGEFTEVLIKDAGGNPVAGAEVWADGRTYSFDLPNRPFTTDENGVARIPLGSDLDRTQLSLRVAGDGIAAPVATFERGAPPESHEITVGSSTRIGGSVVDSDGQPVTDTWVYLKGTSSTTQPDGVVLTGPGANL